MNKIKRLFLLIVACIFAISLAACNGSTPRNNKVPTSSLDMSSVVAKTKDFSVNNSTYYSKLRYNGYNTVYTKIASAIYETELNYVKSQINLGDSNITDEEESLFESLASEIFGTTDVEEIKDFTDEEIDTYLLKYIHSCNNKGIVIKKTDIIYDLSGEDIKFTAIPQEIINEKLLSIAQNKAAKDALKEIVDNEKITDDDGKLVTNSNYISDKDIENHYNNYEKTYGTYTAIIIQFNNLTEARNVIRATEAVVGPLTNDNAIEFYVNLYNTYYNYRPQIDLSNPFEAVGELTKTKFVVNKDKDELSSVSTNIKTLVTTTLDEDNQYIKEPFNQNNKYVMVYRGNTTYDVNTRFDLEVKNEQVEWKDLSEANKVTLTPEIKDVLIDNKVSSYVKTVLQKRLKASSIEIYDPFFEYKFDSNYDDYYDLIDPAKFDNDNIFKIVYNDKTTTYSVLDFYADQSKTSGLSIVFEQLKLDYAYQYKDKFLDNDDISDLEAEVDNAISSFNKNENTSYPTSVGLELYLLANYGYTTRDEVVKYSKVASSALNSYINQKVFDEWAKVNEDGTYPETHDIDYTKLNILENILAAGNANYSSLFSINIDHLLIYIDDNADGTPDDPQAFLKNLSASEKEDFNKALLELSQAIYAEANCPELTESNSIMDILNYVVNAYSKNEPLFSKNDGTTWASYKKYNFLIKVESLSSSGDTTQSNVGNYVTEFGDYVKELYNKAKENDLEIEDNKSIFYFKNSLENAPETIDDICATQFGYHMIIVNDYELPTTTKKTADSDLNGYQKNIEILLNEKDSDTTDDNIYVIVENTYNEDKENEATMNQLFTYYVQLQNGITSTLDSSIREVLSSMFTEAITRYTSSDFQNFLLFEELQITSTNELLSKQLVVYRDYLIKTSQSYDTKDKFNTWYDGSLNWSRPY